MKIAVTASEQDVASVVNPRFGRAPFFAVFDTDEGEWTFIENSMNLKAAQGAGIQSAECLARNDVNVLLTGHVGPKAFTVLNAADINVFVSMSGTLEEALKAYQSGTLTPVQSASVEGHWS